MDAPVVRRGFWARQFKGEYTRAQAVFDLVGGIILSFVWLRSLYFLAAGWHQDSWDERPPYDRFLAVTSSIVVMEMLAMAVWLWFRRKPAGFLPSIGGALLACALLILAIGLPILPFAVLAIWEHHEISRCLPLLLYPFAIAFSSTRAGWRAIRLRKIQNPQAPVVTMALLGSCIAAAPALCLWLMLAPV